MPEKKTPEAENATEESAKKNELLHKVWLLGLGAVAVGEEGATKLYRHLLEKGEEFESRHKDSIDGARKKARDTGHDVKSRVEKGWSQVGEKVDSKFSSALSKVGVTGKELGALKERVDQLSEKVDELKPELAN